jgi:hypothetical protein
MKSYLVGRDPARLEELRFLIANPKDEKFATSTNSSLTRKN